MLLIWVPFSNLEHVEPTETCWLNDEASRYVCDLVEAFDVLEVVSGQDPFVAGVQLVDGVSRDPESHALSLARPMVFVGEKRLVGVRDLRGRRAQTATEIFKVTKYLRIK